MLAELERLRQAAAEAQAQVAEAQAAADEARAQAQAAQLAAATQPTVTQSQVVPLPRPRGETFNIQSAMGLEDDDELYGSIQVSGDGGLEERGHNQSRPTSACFCSSFVSQADDVVPFIAHCQTSCCPSGD